jgi:hypothetical protein
MQIPTWTKPGVTGAVIGALATMIYGFTQGGWYSATSAEKLAADASSSAVIQAFVPVCVGMSKSDPDSAAKMAAFAVIKTSYEQRDFVAKSGWATLPAETSPSLTLATACSTELAKG